MGFWNSKNSAWTLSYVSIPQSSCSYSWTALKPGLWERWIAIKSNSFIWDHSGEFWVDIKWFDHVKDNAVNEKTGLKDLPLRIADRHHSLFGHICRLSPEVPAHRALQLCIDAYCGIFPAPDWRHPPGRPHGTWLKQVEKDLGQPVSAAWITAMDRSMWKSLRPLAGHAQQWSKWWRTSLVKCSSQRLDWYNKTKHTKHTIRWKYNN